jgi:predicted benzoate:H+ symporter BenE
MIAAARPMVTAPGLSACGIGGAFWGLVAGLAAAGLEHPARKAA